MLQMVEELACLLIMKRSSWVKRRLQYESSAPVHTHACVIKSTASGCRSADTKACMAAHSVQHTGTCTASCGWLHKSLTSCNQGSKKGWMLYFQQLSFGSPGEIPCKPACLCIYTLIPSRKELVTLPSLLGAHHP